jgi:SAM-dependent methyltransferase
MDNTQIERVYRDCLPKWAPVVGTEDPFLQYIERYSPPNLSAAILDAGCGNGRYACTLAKRGYTNIEAIDLYDFINTEGLFKYRKCTIDNICLPDRSIDFIYSLSVIYYLNNPVVGIQEFVRVLKPGGLVLITAHTRYSPFTLDRIVRRALGKAPHLRDVHFRSAGEYIGMMRNAGLTVLDTDGIRLDFWEDGYISYILRRLGVAPLFRVWRNASDVSSAGHHPWWIRRIRSEVAYHFVIVARKESE